MMKTMIRLLPVLLLAAAAVTCSDQGRWDDITRTINGLPPVIESFILTSTNQATSQQVTFTLSGTDNKGITGWYVSENPASPAVGDPGWTASAPSQFTLSGGFGGKTLYAWAKDEDGNVSSSRSISLDIVWNPSVWAYRIQIVIAATNITAPLTNFPVYVSLGSLSNTPFFTRVRSDGSDIVILASDSNTVLKREVVSLDLTTSNGQLWFKAPLLVNSASNVFYVYYGSPTFNEINSSDVWSEGFVAVWHLEETGTGIYQDSCSAGNTLRSAVEVNSGYVPPDRTNAIIGYGQDYQNTNAGTYCLNSAALQNMTNFTITLWIKQNYLISGTRWFQKGPLYVWESGGPTLKIDRSFTTADLATTNNVRKERNGAGWLSSWNQVNITWAGTTNRASLTFYRNAVDVGSSNGGESTGEILTDDSAKNFFVGCMDGVTNRSWGSIVDEIRISTNVRTQPWMAAEFTNQSLPANFYQTGPEEAL